MMDTVLQLAEHQTDPAAAKAPIDMKNTVKLASQAAAEAAKAAFSASLEHVQAHHLWEPPESHQRLNSEQRRARRKAVTAAAGNALQLAAQVFDSTMNMTEAAWNVSHKNTSDARAARQRDTKLDTLQAVQEARSLYRNTAENAARILHR